MTAKTDIGSLTLVVTCALLIGNGACAQTATKLEDRVVYAMPGGTGLDVMKECAANHFTKATNVRVDFLASPAPQALSRVILQREHPTIDVVWNTAATDYVGLKAGVYVPLTAALVPNLANIDPSFAPERDRVVTTSSIQGIQYNTRVFREKGWNPPKSWQDLWDPKYKGRVGFNNVSGGSFQAIIAMAAYLNGGDAKNYDAAFENLIKLKQNIYAVFSQAPQYDVAMMDGTTWIGVSNAARPLAMMQSGAPIGFVQPEEGIVVSNSSISLVKGAPHPNAALAFINWMLSKEAQSCLPRAGFPPIIKGLEAPPDVAHYMMVQRKVIPVDIGDFQEKLPDLVKRWHREIEG